MYIALDIISNNSLFYVNICNIYVNISIWDVMYSWYYQELYCVIICLYIVYKTSFKSGPHGRPPVGEWAIPCINIINK